MRILMGVTCAASMLGILPLPAGEPPPAHERREREERRVSVAVGDILRVEGRDYTVTRAIGGAIVLVPLMDAPAAPAEEPRNERPVRLSPDARCRLR